MQIKICQRSAPVWLMSVLQIRSTIPYNARKAVAKVRKIQAGQGVTKREDMEKTFPPVFSNLNLVVVAGCDPVENCLLPTHLGWQKARYFKVFPPQ